jgi:hypothetical protein
MVGVVWDPLRKTNLDFFGQVANALGSGLRLFIEAVAAHEGVRLHRSTGGCSKCGMDGHFAQECQGLNPPEPELYSKIYDIRDMLKIMKERDIRGVFEAYIPEAYKSPVVTTGPSRRHGDKDGVINRVLWDLNELAHHQFHLNSIRKVAKKGTEIYSRARLKPFIDDAVALLREVQLACQQQPQQSQRRQRGSFSPLQEVTDSIERALMSIEHIHECTSTAETITDRVRKMSRFLPDAAIPEVAVSMLEALLDRMKPTVAGGTKGQMSRREFSDAQCELGRDLVRLILPRLASDIGNLMEEDGTSTGQQTAASPHHMHDQGAVWLQKTLVAIWGSTLGRRAVVIRAVASAMWKSISPISPQKQQAPPQMRCSVQRPSGARKRKTRCGCCSKSPMRNRGLSIRRALNRAGTDGLWKRFQGRQRPQLVAVVVLVVVAVAVVVVDPLVVMVMVARMGSSGLEWWLTSSPPMLVPVPAVSGCLS